MIMVSQRLQKIIIFHYRNIDLDSPDRISIVLTLSFEKGIFEK